MMNTCKTLTTTVGGQQITLNDSKYSNLLSPSGILLGVIRYVAKQTGFATEQVDGKLTYSETKVSATVNGETKMISKSFKDLSKEIIEAELATAEDIKALEVEYKTGKDLYYSASTQMAALIGADATLRKVARPVFGQKGNHIGFDVKARYVKAGTSGGAAKDAKIAELEQQIAAFRLLLPAKA